MYLHIKFIGVPEPPHIINFIYVYTKFIVKSPAPENARIYIGVFNDKR